MNSIRECTATGSDFGRRLVAWVFGVLAVLMITACASPYPPAPSDAGKADYDYLIGPLDTLNIIVWRNPELSLAVPVRPDGKVTTPLVDDIAGAGQDAHAARARPREGAGQVHPGSGRHGRGHDVRRARRREQIRVIGEAAKPQVLAFRKNMSLLDVMIQVGGLTDFADGNAASIYRVADGGKSYSVRLRDLVKRGDISANVDMRPGDILIIPQSWF